MRAIPEYEIHLHLKFFNTFDSDAENICKKYYEELGYIVLKTDNKKAFKKLMNLIAFPNSIKEINISLIGIPDFLVYKIITKDGKIVVNEYFFVEAKSPNDFLSQVQIGWLLKYPLEKVIVFWLKQPNYNIYFDEVK